jgi:hypothetical protein
MKNLRTWKGTIIGRTSMFANQFANLQSCGVYLFLLTLPDKVRDPFTNHHRGHVGISPDAVGHDGGVNHPQTLKAMHCCTGRRF